MTAFLASIASVEEAAIARRGGADIFACESPGDGRALAPMLVTAIVQAIGAPERVCASIDVRKFTPALILEGIAAMEAAGAGLVKINLPGDSDRAGTLEVIQALGAQAQGARRIAVFHGDRAPDFSLIPALALAGFYGAMIDTADKTRGRLLNILPVARIGDFIDACAASGLASGLAGSLEEPDIPRLIALGPDFLGFRSALCIGLDRRNAFDATFFARIRATIPMQSAPETSVQPGDNTAFDTIFLRDYLVSMAIGAYTYEQGHTQRVRFSVEADVARPERGADTFGAIVSYDVFVDAIDRIVQSGHVALVETMAESLAAAALRNPRILRVRIRVEKLDIVAGIVGVEISRESPGAPPSRLDALKHRAQI